MVCCAEFIDGCYNVHLRNVCSFFKEESVVTFVDFDYVKENGGNSFGFDSYSVRIRSISFPNDGRPVARVSST